MGLPVDPDTPEARGNTIRHNVLVIGWGTADILFFWVRGH